MSKISDDNKPKVRANYIDQLVSQRLKIRRILRGVSQQELGNAIGVSVQQVQKYEKAANRISSGKLHIIATYMDRPLMQEKNNTFLAKKANALIYPAYKL